MKTSCLYWSGERSIVHIIDALRHNKLVLGTSDTILGLLAPLTRLGLDKLNKIKGRTDKPYIVLIGDRNIISLFAQTPLGDLANRLVDHCWPGPLTLIVKAKKELPSYLKTKEVTIALRMPHHQGLLSLLRHFDGLFSTSANKSDMPVPQALNEVDQQIVEQVDCCVFDKIEQTTFFSAKPSTILDCTGPTIYIVREGAYPLTELEKLCGHIHKKSIQQ